MFLVLKEILHLLIVLSKEEWTWSVFTIHLIGLFGWWVTYLLISAKDPFT